MLYNFKSADGKIFSIVFSFESISYHRINLVQHVNGSLFYVT